MKILLRAVSKRDAIAPSAVVIVKQKRFARRASVVPDAHHVPPVPAGGRMVASRKA